MNTYTLLINANYFRITAAELDELSDAIDLAGGEWTKMHPTSARWLLVFKMPLPAHGVAKWLRRTAELIGFDAACIDLLEGAPVMQAGETL